MRIFDVLSLIGGLCLFLFGVNLMDAEPPEEIVDKLKKKYRSSHIQRNKVHHDNYVKKYLQ